MKCKESTPVITVYATHFICNFYVFYVIPYWVCQWTEPGMLRSTFPWWIIHLKHVKTAERSCLEEEIRKCKWKAYLLAEEFWCFVNKEKGAVTFVFGDRSSSFWIITSETQEFLVKCVWLNVSIFYYISLMWVFNFYCKNKKIKYCIVIKVF